MTDTTADVVCGLSDMVTAKRQRIAHLEMVMRECCDAIRDGDEFGALRMLEVALKDQAR